MAQGKPVAVPGRRCGKTAAFEARRRVMELLATQLGGTCTETGTGSVRALCLNFARVLTDDERRAVEAALGPYV
jgi:hypothetical protein